MQRKYYLIMGLVAILGIFLISGCVKQTPPQQTEELNIKAYIVEKYNPGRCFGIPGPVPDELVSRTLNQNANLVTFVKNEFGVIKDYEVYTKIDQLEGIILTKTDYGYNFTFKDGNCCNIHTYEGKIRVDENQITDEVINKYTENVAC